MSRLGLSPPGFANARVYRRPVPRLADHIISRQSHPVLQRQPDLAQVLCVRVGDHLNESPPYHQIAIDLSSPPAELPNVHPADGNQRYVDIENAKLASEMQEGCVPSGTQYTRGGLAEIHYRQNTDTRVRVVAALRAGGSTDDKAGSGDEGTIYFRVFGSGDAIQPSRVAGDASSTKVLRIALTIDDGPSGRGAELTNNLYGQLGELKATWYIQRNKVNWFDSQFTLLKKIQDEGGEIAIHSFHPSQDHSVWFPIEGRAGNSNYSYPFFGETESFIMNDSAKGLKGFYDKLKEKGIKPRFVRLPGGLRSELELYAAEKGVANPGAFVDDLVNGRSIDKYGDGANQIQDDFELIKQTLSSLNLLLWGGDANPLEIQGQSWGGESQPGDDGGNRDYILKQRKFKNAVDAVAGGPESSAASLVILSHDTQRGYLTELMGDPQAQGEDKKGDLTRMHEYANTAKVKLEYYTMSQLFQLTTGQNPDGYDVNY